MQTYTVHEPTDESGDRMERAERLVFVKDGFSLTAAILGPIWFLANRQWLALLAYVGIVIALELIAFVLGAGQLAIQWCLIALHLVIGLEADSIRRWTLGRADYRMVGSVSGRDLEDCERRFLEIWLKDQPLYSSHAGGAAAGGSVRGTGGRLTTMALWQGR